MTPNYINITAGIDKKSFCVHKDVLTSKAAHFADGLRSGIYREAQENQFELPDVRSDVVAAFVNWLYKDTLVEIPNNVHDSYGVTVRLYEFADSINLTVLQNQCIDHVMKIKTKTNVNPTWRLAAAHYDNSVSNDMMRKLLVDIRAGNIMNSKKANVRAVFKDGLLNDELVVDLLFRINEAGVSSCHKLKALRSTEYYHLHDDLAKIQAAPTPT